ncbi:MAG: hybrid sensor histidine kinase/response regulator [Phycisphaerae bacterium]
MRIRQHMTTIIATCTFLGIGLAFALGFSYQMLAAQARSLHEDSGTVSDVGRLAKDSEQWITTVNMVVESGQAYLLEGAKALANQLHASMDAMEERTLIQEFPDQWASVRNGISEIGGLLGESEKVMTGNADGDLQMLASSVGSSAESLQTALGELSTSTEQLAGERLAGFDMQRQIVHLMACFCSGAYLLVTFGFWRWTRKNLVIPTELLAAEINEAIEKDQPLSEYDFGPPELREIAGRFRQLAESVDEKVSCRTYELEVQQTATEALNHELSQINELLESVRHDADAAFRAKSAFLANMTSDIRNPTQDILNVCDRLTQDVADVDQASVFLDSVRQNSETLLHAIDDLLMLSSIESQRIVMNYAPCDLEDVMRRVIADVKPHADAKALAFEVEADETLPPMLHSDADRLQKVLFNVLMNAVEHTEQGSVRCHVQMMDDQAVPAVAFDILDTGVGYPEDAVHRVFEPFSAGVSCTSSQQGEFQASLSMATSRKLAQLLGGDAFIINSELGVGTHTRVVVAIDPMGELAGSVTPRVRLPEELMDEGGEGNDPCSLQGLHVMLADQSPTVRSLVSYMLAQEGVFVETFDSPELACHEAMQLRDTDQAFDLLLLDMEMPVEGSRDLGERLRDLGYRGVILALVSGDVDHSDMYQDLGINDVIVKPIQRETLLNKIRYQLAPAAE